MSATDNIERRAVAGQSRLKRFVSNLTAAVVMFFRSRRPPDRRPAWPPHGRLATGAVVAITIVIATVVALDVRLASGARELPATVTATFQRITHLGLSGWFLYPVGFLLLAMAAADSPALPSLSRRVLAAISLRLGFVFMAIAVPGLSFLQGNAGVLREDEGSAIRWRGRQTGVARKW